MSSVWLNPSLANAASMASASALERVTKPSAKAPAAETPADASSYWSISTTMRPGSLSAGSVQEANEIAAAVTDTAALGLEQATDIVARIQQKLVLAKAVGADREAINADIQEMKTDLGAVVSESSFNGDNWLAVEAGGRPKVASLLASVTTGEDGGLSINMVDFDTAKSTLISRQEAKDGMLTRAYAGTTLGGVPYNYYLMEAGAREPNEGGAREIRIGSSTSGDEIDGMISSLNRVLIDMVGASAEVSATRNQVTSGDVLVQGLRGATELGVSRLVDTELNEQSVRLTAEKVQDQLQSSSLNIANVSMTSWLKL
ncbi:flagellin N-terminal helical domain-containing protein [Rhizobium rosettiformans]|uniref:flagellin N-terminal helical domain-containing protein n=1 Tax=Rhizobium rosettiformans TaxID=1368430 RepID=UPI0028586F77|nr:flagellar hook associated protein [Rhizobium rosettiformans]MDR7029693.1 flagellin [Rhizobium rosettiformans]MDR7063407.1 flagellin [Rhizobium rosettiformans]